MSRTSVFLSVGSNGSTQQEAFVEAIETRLRAEGLDPRTLGRSDWDSSAPLRPIVDLLAECSGAVILALERSYFQSGTERRGGDDEKQLSNVVLPTVWNQIEAALAYSKGLPMLVICEEGMQSEGLLEARYDWYVQRVKVDLASLTTPEFNGVLASWKDKLSASKGLRGQIIATDPASMTVGQLFGAMRPTHLVTVLGTMAAALASAFALGTRFGP